MMKKYQVFLSSTAEDLAEERSLIIKRMISKEQLFPIAMEHFLASDNTIDMLFNYLRNTDIYVLIIGDSYGSEIGTKFAAHLLSSLSKDPFLQTLADIVGREQWNLTDLAKISFTELEYCIAKALGLKCLVFIKTSTLEQIRSENTNSQMEKFYMRYREHHAFMQWNNAESLCSNVLDSLESAILTDSSLTGWVRELDVPIISTARKAGIQKLALDGRMNPEDLATNLSHAKEIKIFCTTGESFIKANNNYLSLALTTGCHIQLLCGDPHSPFLTDVQTIEELQIGDRFSIHHEFKNVMNELHNIYVKARNTAIDPSCLGTIEVASYGTLFRSTIIICRRENNSKWGWLTVTLPPLKSRDSLSFVFEYTDGDSKENVLVSTESHFDYVWSLAKKNQSIITVSDIDTSLNKKSSETTIISEGDRKYWEDQYRKAVKTMKSLRKNRRVLIEVAAQHPLVEGEPGQEFQARLDRAYELYCENLKKGYEAEIFVPGSVHLDEDGFPEEESLSNAGVKYLLETYPMPPEVIHGEDLIQQYQDGRYWKGVYNTGDECYIATQYFLNGDRDFGRLVTVCSPWQLIRKALFYIDAGIIPDIYTVPTKKMFHSFLGELFESLPHVLHEDHNYQSPDSREALRTRKERMPDFS